MVMPMLSGLTLRSAARPKAWLRSEPGSMKGPLRCFRNRFERLFSPFHGRMFRSSQGQRCELGKCSLGSLLTPLYPRLQRFDLGLSEKKILGWRQEWVEPWLYHRVWNKAQVGYAPASPSGDLSVHTGVLGA